LFANRPDGRVESVPRGVVVVDLLIATKQGGLKMLVLSRRVGEQIHIGEGIVVTVIGSRGNNIRLGVEAPANVPVDREEISARKRAERRGLDGATLAASRPR
jgi:carbon storage regulator